MDGNRQYPLITLIGPMGAGKTTIGKLLAQYLGYQFYDSDHEVEASTGASIGWIFDKEGEQGFRLRESRAIDYLTQKNHVVLATGGGAVVTPINQQYLKRGIVVYLRAEVAVQYERTCRDKNRPLLKTENPKQRLAELFAVRDPIYQQLADIVVTTGHSSPKKMVESILHQLDSYTQTHELSPYYKCENKHTEHKDIGLCSL
ncbi:MULTISPECIES: shikimate kinase [unclassified Moraxella]|uniref:shikimate kinase n=1 Tax=unclassified Moraxella TaxID=2685852 RepID=UPI003AF76245